MNNKTYFGYRGHSIVDDSTPVPNAEESTGQWKGQ